MSDSTGSVASVDLNTINDLEELVVELTKMHELQESKHRYRLADHGTNDMLDWKNPPQIQPLPIEPFYRVGIVGDGNCMLHTILFATSPTYRGLNYKSQSKLTDTFREVLKDRAEDIRVQMDILYAPVGGSVVFEDSFNILNEDREELEIVMGPAICRLYGHNFLAVRLDENLVMEPVRQTFNEGAFDPDLSTVLVHYMGGNVDVGVKEGFAENGHYEVIIAAPPDALLVVGGGDASNSNSNISGSEDVNQKDKKGRKRAKHITRKAKHRERAGVRVTLEEDLVQFDFAAGDPNLDTVLALFLVEEELAPEYVHPLEAAVKKAQEAEGGDSVAEGGARRRRRRHTRRHTKRNVNHHSRQ
jgi:hypothetical protein